MIPGPRFRWPQPWRTVDEDCACTSCLAFDLALRDHERAIAHAKATRERVRLAGIAIDQRHGHDDGHERGTVYMSGGALVAYATK